MNLQDIITRLETTTRNPIERRDDFYVISFAIFLA